MAKKYYWLKLKNDFFTQPKIKKLRRIAGGDTLTIIYLKLQLLSLHNEGKLYFEGIEETFVEELSLTIDEDKDNILLTLQYLLHQGLIEEVDQDEYVLTETTGLIGSETAVAERVRRMREKEKKALHCNAPVTSCNTEIEIEKEIEKELDKEKETYKSIINAYTSNADLVDALNGYVEMRQKMKGFTKRALKLNLNELNKLAFDDETKISIVNQSIKNSWKGVYPLKNDNKPKHDDSIDNPLKNERRAF